MEDAIITEDYTISNFNNFLSKCTISQKKSMLLLISESIKMENINLRKKNDHVKFSDYVEVVDEFVPSVLLDEAIIAEVEIMGLNLNSNKPQTQWLSMDDREYCFSDNYKLKHAPKKLSEFNNICRLMDQVNKHPSTTQDANSALVIVYNSENAAINFHDDGESLMDNKSSISTVTFGPSRKVQFCDKATWPRLPQYSIDCGHHGLMIMHPGCQETLVHRVCRGNENTMGQRIVISFRKVKTLEEGTTSEESSKEYIPTSQIPPPHINKSKKICLIAGDSHSFGLDAEKLSSKGRECVKNLSQQGATIPDVQKQLEDFFTKNEEAVVDKVFLCVGTNDIRKCGENGTRGLKVKLLYLVEQVKLMYPDACVWIQSLIPLPWQNKFTFKNVEQFNDIIYEVCKQTQSFYLNIFKDFLVYNLRCKGFRRQEAFFVSLDNIHLNSRFGLSRLARRYINIIHSTYNPLGY